jgi:tRNA nucleotidyltransferase/poly(A) polymerase
MQISEILELIKYTANKKGISEPFLCGGTPRDKVLNKLNNISDIDITTGDSTIHNLAKEISIALPNANYKLMDDGHAQLIIDGLKVDFSSNFIVPGLRQLLSKVGVNKPTDMQLEMYSRDFTINSMILTIDLKTVKDPIGLGLKDIGAKIIKTCLPARITLSLDQRRVIRIIYIAAKMNFNVDKEIIDWVKTNPKSVLAEGNKSYVSNKLNKALKYNKDKVIELANMMDLWNYLPINKELIVTHHL